VFAGVMAGRVSPLPAATSPNFKGKSNVFQIVELQFARIDNRERPAARTQYTLLRTRAPAGGGTHSFIYVVLYE